MEETRDKIQKWLMNEGWQIAEPTHPEFAWLIQAEDAGGRRILVGQNKARPDQIHLEARVNLAEEYQKMFETLAEDRRRDTPDWGPHPESQHEFGKGLQTTSGLIEFESSSLRKFDPDEDDAERPFIPKYIPSWEGHHTTELILGTKNYCISGFFFDSVFYAVCAVDIQEFCQNLFP